MKKTFKFLILSILGFIALSLEAQEKTTHIADNFLSINESEIKEGETLEILFNQPGGMAIWNTDCPLEIEGNIVSNGLLIINSPTGILLGKEAHINSLGIKLLSEGSIISHGHIETSGYPIHLIGSHIELRNGSRLNASSELGGGDIFVGGGWHGRDPTIRNAKIVTVDRKAQMLSDALQKGTGGDVVLFSEEETLFLGDISAQGPGSGGSVEVSSNGRVIFDGFVNMLSSSGTQGTLLLDPATIVIQASGPDIDGLGLGDDITSANELSNPATYPGVNSIITSGAVDALLTGGASMTLAATDSITVNSPISAAGVVGTLTFDAPLVYLNEPIDLPFGGMIAGTATIVDVGQLGTIQDGVDAAAAGGTVNLAAGTYIQEVYIGKPLTLNGSGSSSTHIVCPTSPTPLNNTFVFTINGATYHPIILAEGAADIIIQNMTVDGNSQASNFLSYRFVGIGYHNAGGTVQNNLITEIQDSSPGGGTQHGFGVFGAIDSGTYTIEVLNNTITQFQKQAITMRGPGLTTVISGNTIIGENPPSAATMNGIVIQNSAVATISGNSVSNILTGSPGNDSVGIMLFTAGPNTTISSNSITNGNIGIYCLDAGNNLMIVSNIVDTLSTIGVYVQDTAGLTTITSNEISCNPASSNSLGIMVENPDTGAPIGRTFLGSTPKYNMYLYSGTNQPFHLNTNTFNPCDIGLAAEGTGATGPVVTMNQDRFNGTPTYYIQLLNNPNNTWPSTATVSFNGLVSGYITYEQYLDIQSRLFGNFQDPAFGTILEYLQPFTPIPPAEFLGELSKDKFLNTTKYFLLSTWTNSASPNATAYGIYLRGNFVESIPASSKNIFFTALKCKKEAYQYTVTTFNSTGLESTPTPITVIDD